MHTRNIIKKMQENKLYLHIQCIHISVSNIGEHKHTYPQFIGVFFLLHFQNTCKHGEFIMESHDVMTKIYFYMHSILHVKQGGHLLFIFNNIFSETQYGSV